MMTDPNAELADTRVALELSHDDAGAVLNALVWRELHLEQEAERIRNDVRRPASARAVEVDEHVAKLRVLERVIAHVAGAMHPPRVLVDRSAPGSGTLPVRAGSER